MSKNRENIAQRALIGLVKVYRKYLSPAKGQPSCRYYPTCSAYAIEAIRIHGALKGSALTVWRILRCNPFSKGGVDPVPGSELAKRRERDGTLLRTAPDQTKHESENKS